jgi:hypothetical protein
MKLKFLLLPPRSTKRRGGWCAPYRIQTSLILFQLHKLDQGEDEGVEPRMSGSLEFGSSGGAARAAGGVVMGTVDPSRPFRCGRYVQ